MCVRKGLTRNQMGVSYLFTATSATQEAPTALLEEVVRVLVDSLHDGSPVQVDRPFAERDVDGAKDFEVTLARKMDKR